MKRRKSFLAYWVRWWAALFVAAALAGFLIHPPSAWWPVINSDDGLLLTALGAMACTVVHRVLLKRQALREAQLAFRFEDETGPQPTDATRGEQ